MDWRKHSEALSSREKGEWEKYLGYWETRHPTKELRKNIGHRYEISVVMWSISLVFNKETKDFFHNVCMSSCCTSHSIISSPRHLLCPLKIIPHLSLSSLAVSFFPSLFHHPLSCLLLPIIFLLISTSCPPVPLFPGGAGVWFVTVKERHISGLCRCYPEEHVPSVAFPGRDDCYCFSSSSLCFACFSVPVISYHPQLWASLCFSLCYSLFM